MTTSSLFFKSEKDLQDYAAKLAQQIKTPTIIFLSGILGAGKTTFVRGFLRGLGFTGAVKSPSFSLVEEYHLHNQWFYHFDFYRIHDPHELIGLGLRDYISQGTLIIEWAEHALSALPSPDLHLQIDIVGDSRNIKLEAATNLGQQILECMKSDKNRLSCD